MACKKKKAPIIALLMLLSLTQHGQAIDAQIFENPSEWDPPEQVIVSTEDLFSVTPYTSDWQSRSFFFVGRLDNGTFFVINPFFWRYGMFHSWGLSVLVTDENGRLFSYNGSQPLTCCEMTSEGLDLRLGRNVFSMSGSETRVSIALDGFSCDLSIINILPPWKPGNGWAWYNAAQTAFSRYSIAAPLALVSGSMTVFGGSMDASGQCFLDTNYSVQPLKRPNSPAFILRAFSLPDVPRKDRVFIDMLESVTNKGYGSLPLSMLLVAKGDSWLFTARDFTLTPDEWVSLSDPPYPYPRSYKVLAEKSGFRLEGEFTATRLYHTTDVFQSIPRFLRRLASLFLKRPVLYRMIGWFHGNLVFPDGSIESLAMPAHGEYIVVN
jgi:hypothetical protein